LLDEANFALTFSAVAGGEQQLYPSGFHLGINLQTKDALSAAHAKRTSAGVKIAHPLGELAGALTFQYYAPGGLLVELAWRAM
jgi:hypothetical protein